ncbi:MAG: hypothetical protein Q9M92_03180 [Enterobacterales bacterium]|nr:hypothetical protein [Enterobacterales bacterium]
MPTDQSITKGKFDVVYHFGDQVMTGDDLEFSVEGIKLSKFENKLVFSTENPYADFC